MKWYTKAENKENTFSILVLGSHPSLKMHEQIGFVVKKMPELLQPIP
jgi:hypothetical protein